MLQRDPYNVERVHKVNILITIAIVLLLAVQASITAGIARGLSIGLQGGIVVALSLLNWFLPLKPYIKGLLFAAIPGIVVSALFYLDVYALNKHYLLVMTLAMAALYFRRELILIQAAIIDVLLIAIFYGQAGTAAGRTGRCPSFRLHSHHLQWNRRCPVFLVQMGTGAGG